MSAWVYDPDTLPERNVLVELKLGDGRIVRARRRMVKEGWDRIEDDGRRVVDEGSGVDWGDYWLEDDLTWHMQKDVIAWREVSNG